MQVRSLLRFVPRRQRFDVKEEADATNGCLIEARVHVRRCSRQESRRCIGAGRGRHLQSRCVFEPVSLLNVFLCLLKMKNKKADSTY